MSCTLAPPSPEIQPKISPRKFPATRKLPGFIRVLFWMLVFFVGLELVVRFALVPASKDFSRFRTYPDQASQLLDNSGFRIGFLGNSTTQYGVDSEIFAKEMHHRGIENVHAGAFPSDASKINTWYYVASSCLLKTPQSPEMIVVNFYGNNLIDGNRIEIGRLAQFFTTTRDWPEVMQYDLPRIGDRVEFVLASCCMTLAARERIRQRVFKTFVPGYEVFTQELNRINRDLDPTPMPEVEGDITHVTLKRFIERAKQHNVHLVFVAFPIRDCISGQPYDLRPETNRIIAEAGMDLIDARFNTGLSASDYLDELHLNLHGREIYSAKLAQILQPIVKRTREKNHPQQNSG